MLKAQFVSAKNDDLVVGAGVGGDGWQLLARGRHLQVGGLIHIGSAWPRVKGRNKSRELPCDDMIVIPVFQLPEHVPHFDIVRTQTPFIIIVLAFYRVIGGLANLLIFVIIWKLLTVF